MMRSRKWRFDHRGYKRIHDPHLVFGTTIKLNQEVIPPCHCFVINGETQRRT
ncbi:hypothetical protein LEMLEM_LOCUS8583 [Lemmus lemmus]